MKQHDQAALFLAKAAKDEALVDEVLGSERVADEIVGFHLQQAAEKLLKGVLSAYGVSFRRTHDLRELMDAATDTPPRPAR
jgi:HEPN domain-containing protein